MTEGRIDKGKWEPEIPSLFVPRQSRVSYYLMRVLLEPGSTRCVNMGDVAMTQAAVRRIQSEFPGVEIHIFTEDVARLARYCPGVHPADLGARSGLVLPSRLDWGLRRRLPYPLISLWDRVRSRQRPQNEFYRFLSSCDLVAIAGMGGLTDVFQRHAWTILELLGAAQAAGVPTALFGQGLGPIEDSCLRSQAAHVLRRVHLLALRESLAGPDLAAALGVPDNRVTVTGDDAVELAFERRPPELGNAIGVNLRVSDYAGSDQGLLKPLREVLQAVSSRFAAPLLAVPISFHQHESDVASAASLGCQPGAEALDSPEAVMQQAGRCRVVMTGSYHAAVFALSQGVPVVAIANTPYYADKFQGVAGMFGTGCEVLSSAGEGFQTRLERALVAAWESADQVRTPLLHAARRQAEAGRAAYAKLQVVAAGRKVT